MPKLFTTPLVGCHLDAIEHATEKFGKVKALETKVVVLTLRVADFNREKALALDERVHNALFKLSSPEPRRHIKRVDFSIGRTRQNLLIYATTDSPEASIQLTRVGIRSLVAKASKVLDYELIIKAAFGPADKHELEFVEMWRGTQRWITFEEFAPELNFEAKPEALEGADISPVIDGRPLPTWDDGETKPESEHAREVGAAPAKKRGTKKKTGRHDPEAEAAQQRAAGKDSARDEAQA